MNRIKEKAFYKGLIQKLASDLDKEAIFGLFDGGGEKAPDYSMADESKNYSPQEGGAYEDPQKEKKPQESGGEEYMDQELTPEELQALMYYLQQSAYSGGGGGYGNYGPYYGAMY